MDESSLLADARSAVPAGPLGSETNPVRCFQPTGERDYLSRLRWRNGLAPDFARLGSGVVGPYGNVLDHYVISCGEDRRDVFMDMYHRDYLEEEAIDGWYMYCFRLTKDPDLTDRTLHDAAQTLQRIHLQLIPLQQVKELVLITAIECGNRPIENLDSTFRSLLLDYPSLDERHIRIAFRFVTGHLPPVVERSTGCDQP